MLKLVEGLWIFREQLLDCLYIQLKARVVDFFEQAPRTSYCSPCQQRGIPVKLVKSISTAHFNFHVLPGSKYRGEG